MVDDSTAETQADSSQVSDPYVIYQLRKPSQRGTAVIPRFVPNTHAPAFSPANYRFARVWTANDHTAVSPSALLHVPRSFEYAGSLGSESSFWSDTSSWVSVSSLRTAPSEARAPLLHSNQNPVSAASFFNSDLENARIRNSYRASSARSSDIDSPIPPDFRYPPALSESVSEDAVIDDLLSLEKPQYPHLRNHSTVQTTARDHSGVHRQSSHRKNHPSSHHRSPAARSNQTRSALPTLTHKRRSLWQWLFCTNKAAMSTTVPSVTISQTAAAVRERIRPINSSPHPHTASPQTDNLRKRSSPKPQSKDRIPKADREFLDRTQRAPDAPAAKSKATRRRNPSFEIRRGKPKGTTKSGRSMSWNFMPKVLLGRDSGNVKQAKEKKRKKSKAKDTSRQLPAEEPKQPRKLHRIVFQRSSTRKGMHTGKEASRDRKRTVPTQVQRTPNVSARKELPKTAQSNVNWSREDRPREDRPREDRPRRDRPREDRPREASKPLLETMTGAGAPQPKSIVPSLREKQTNGSSQIQRMRSTGSSEPVTSRISSDLSSTTYGRTNESDSSRSTPSRLRQSYRPATHELDPAANGVSSDVSSHASGAAGKTSPAAIRTDHCEDYSTLSSPKIRGIDPTILSHDSPHRTPLFAFPSTSSGSDGFTEMQSKTTVWDSPPTDYPEYTNTFGNFGSTAPELIAIMDPVARAREKNRARSAGGPLSYLMKQHDPDEDANTQSTGLTSLADESVSTHKTVSVTGDEYQYRSQLPGGLHRQLYGETYKPSKSQDAQENRSSGNTGTSRSIFQNYAMNPSRAKSPSHASSGASPRRYHSDWSDPHATDIDVYCQCNCSCVYEEECRRSCELIYGRSPSVSSTRSRHGHKGFKTLPPTIQTNGRQSKTAYTDLHDNTEREPVALQNGLGGGVGHRQPSQRTYLRANVVDELPNPESERFYSDAYKLSQSGQGAPGSVPGVFPGTSMSPEAVGQEVHVRGNPRPPYRSEILPNGGKQDYRSLHHQSSSSHRSKGSDGTRASTPRGGPRNEEMNRERDGYHRDGPGLHEDGYGSKDGKHRSSSRPGGQHHRSKVGSGWSGRQHKSRNEPKTDKASKTRSKKKDGEPRVAHEWEAASRSEGAQQMGNSYVVKRSGLPPTSQAYVPQTQRGGEHDGGLGHEDGIERGFGHEHEPVVEREHEKRGGSRQKERSRSRHGHKRQQVSGREGGRRSKSRQTSKNSGRSRTPVFGVL